MSTQTRENELDHYAFDLPRELIAQHPLPCREDSRLLVVNRKEGELEHAHFRDIGNWLAPGDSLVLNNTKVIPARLIGHRTKTGGRWQGLFLETDENGLWRMLCKTRGRMAPGETVTLRDRDGAGRDELIMVSQFEDGSWAARPAKARMAMDLLDELGHVPLPHYIRDGNMVDADMNSYQTVFAEHDGSIAAPTAGLHFTERLLKELTGKGINTEFVTLHIGTGTFRPISCDSISDHKMHSEFGSIDEITANRLNETRMNNHRVIAVGTTSTRLLESSGLDQPPYHAWEGMTDLFIRPPYHFQAIDALLTNFHLPRSTLLVLVRTFGGDELIQYAYREAVKQKYRFFSYGDAMLIV